MRISITGLITFAPLVAAFVPSGRHAFAPQTRASPFTPTVAAASTHEEDLELTRKVIMDYIAAVDDSGSVVDDEDDSGRKEELASSNPPKAKKQKKEKKKQATPEVSQEIDISKLNILVGVIKKAWEHEEADKLFCEEIDVGEPELRQIASGLRAYYSTEDLVGRRVCVLANLKSRKLMGFPSHGMVLCASTDDGSKVVFVDPPEDAEIGERVLVDGFAGEPATENQVIKKKMLDAIFPDLRTDSNGIASFKGVPLRAGTGKCIAEGGLENAQVS
ncbi:hypothetical protein ACHAWF_004999 [Thalassiosira exigua]